MLQKGVSVLILLLIAFWWHSCVPVAQQTGGATGTNADYYSPDNRLRFENYVYDPNVKTVQLYLKTGRPQDLLNPAITPLSQDQPLMLEFDQLNTPQQRFLVKFIYCNVDWTEARITQIQYMQDFNEFYITDVSPSFNTHVLYFHYRFRVPQVKLSGNYLLVVTDQNGRNILSRRMLVYDQVVGIDAKPTLTPGGSAQFTNQQIDFNILYNQYNIVNPAQEVKVVMRQNYRWDNAKYGLQPLYIRDAERRLEYIFFDLKHTFLAGNEYRFFDNRSNRFLGANIAESNRQVVPEEIVLVTDVSRAIDPYSQQIDINGQYIIGNRDFGNDAVNADYNWVTFILKVAKPAPGNVFVFAELSNWNLREGFQLQYNPATQTYSGRVLLKQGYYNYSYALQPIASPAHIDETYFEGSFSLTENIYDILVYYRPPGTRTDLLIGYQVVKYNGRP